jgi:hypothetical protein
MCISTRCKFQQPVFETSIVPVVNIVNELAGVGCLMADWPKHWVAFFRLMKKSGIIVMKWNGLIYISETV